MGHLCAGCPESRGIARVPSRYLDFRSHPIVLDDVQRPLLALQVKWAKADNLRRADHRAARAAAERAARCRLAWQGNVSGAQRGDDVSGGGSGTTGNTGILVERAARCGRLSLALSLVLGFYIDSTRKSYPAEGSN